MTSRSSNRRSAEPDERVIVGRVLSAHGIRGELKIESLSDNPDRFGSGARIRVGSRTEPPRTLEIASSRPHKNHLLVRFVGIADRSAADELRGSELFVLQEEVPEPPEGSWYHYQLEGCRVVDGKRGELGRVRRVVEDGGGEILEVRGPERTVLIPFADPFLRRVDVAEGIIEVELPEGLVETCGST